MPINKNNNELLKQIEELKNEIKKLKSRKKYGLVWEEKEEQVVLDCQNKLPILKEVKNKEIKTDKNKPVNILIEGDNYHSLSVLNYTHREKIDVIYIDPPYNTGAKNWRYNNDYVDKEDSYRHSKFISFIKHRLALAKNLLSKNGFFICAIDHNELFTLGLLFDEYFGEDNRLGLVTILHNPKGRNFTRFFSANSEYMLVYAKNSLHAYFNDVAIDDDIKKSFDLIGDDGRRYRLEPFMRARTETSRKNKPSFWYPIYVSKDLLKFSLKSFKDSYEVYPVTKDNREFTWINLPDTFADKLNDDLFIAKKINGKIEIFRKFFEQQVYKNVWVDKKYQSEFNGTNVLKKILGEKIFDYPKSIYLLEDILKITSNKNSTILDFFAGSGTTGHAVLNINKEDGGNRKFIMCTNNENNICEDVTYKRLSRVINGYKNNENIEKLGGNLKYYKTAFVDTEHINKISDDSKIKLTYQVGEMIALRENILDEVEKNEWWQIFSNDKKILAIYFKEDKSKLQKLVSKLNKENKKVILYIFSWGKNEYKNEFSDYKNIRVEDIPEPILEVYKEINKL